MLHDDVRLQTQSNITQYRHLPRGSGTARTDRGSKIKTSRPSGFQPYEILPRNWLSTVRLVSFEPNPLCVGTPACGPPRSLQAISSLSERAQVTRSAPSTALRAPYLAAFVASSCRMSAKDVTASERIVTVDGPARLDLSASPCEYGARTSDSSFERATSPPEPSSFESPGWMSSCARPSADRRPRTVVE